MRCPYNSKIKRSLCLFSYKEVYFWSYNIKVLWSGRKTIFYFKRISYSFKVFFIKDTII
nr:MAG TPA: hypothetical protein [Caudoviricetes sp.]